MLVVASVSLPAGSAAGQARTAASDPTVVIRSQHQRILLPQDVIRLAVGDTTILSADLVTSREVLILGRETGRTSLIVWFVNGATREFRFSVQRDLSVLARALKRVHASIEVESAPDRDALILTGTVPDLAASLSAEAVARNYLDAGGTGVSSAAQPLVAAAPAAAPAQAAQGGQAPAPTPTPATTQLQAAPERTGAVINLLQLEQLPLLPEDKVREAIRSVGGEQVMVRRVLRGNVRDDARDTLVLEGHVANQTALVRVLVLAARLFAGQALSGDDIRVLADEGGALADSTQTQTQSAQTQLGGGAASSLFGGARSNRLSNQIRTNLGRAKAVEAAGGRLLSFIEVADLPQVRVDIRLVEVNRTKLRALNPNTVFSTSDFRQPSLNPAQSAVAAQGQQAARVGASGAAVQNVLSFLNGGLLNEVQYAGAHLAVDSALSMLERQGIAQNLSSPSLTVLSGEMAQVQIGGEVPVPAAFAPAFGAGATTGGAAPGATPGVFSSVEFVPFGVQLQIRPLVGEDDTVTLDVQPLVVTPDAVLTDTIRQSTGATVATTAFQTRALRTSARLQDGETLLIGGLTSANTSANVASTPGLRRLPILGRLFQGSNRNDQDTELIVVVNPVVVRPRVPNVGVWAFPEGDTAPGGAGAPPAAR